MIRANSFFTYRLLAEYLWRDKLTASGRILVLAGVVCGSFGMSSIEVPLYRLFFPLLMIGVCAWVGGLLFRPRPTVDGELPRTVTAGHEVTATFRLTNHARHTAYDVSVAALGLPAAFESTPDARLTALAPGKTEALPLAFTPTRRGAYVLPPVRAFSTFPFGIVRSGAARWPARPLLVAPAYRTLDALDIAVGRTYQPGGIALTSNIGESTEYIGNRDYRRGDPIRRIDFRAWGRLARPVVKKFQEEYYCRIALVLDTYIGPPRRFPSWLRFPRRAPDSPPALEAAISLTAAVADALAMGEHVIDLFAVGPELYVFRAGRHIDHLENVLEILACVEPSHKLPNEVLMPALAEELASITTAVCLLLDWDDARRDMVRSIAEAGCGLKVIVVADHVSEDAFAGEAWAEACRVVPPARVLAGGVDAL